MASLSQHPVQKVSPSGLLLLGRLSPFIMISSSFFLSPRPVEKCSFTTWSSLHLFALSVSRTLGPFLVIPFLLTTLLFFSYLNTEKDLAILSNCYLTVVFKNVTSSLTVLCLDHIACLKLLSLREKLKT